MSGPALDETLRRARVDAWAPLDLADVARRARAYRRRRRALAVCAVAVPLLAVAATLTAVVPPGRELAIATQAPAEPPPPPGPSGPAPLLPHPPAVPPPPAPSAAPPPPTTPPAPAEQEGPDAAPTPSPEGAPAPPPTPAVAPHRLLLEAEDGVLTAPMEVVRDPGTGAASVGVAESTGPSARDPNPGAVDLEVLLPAAGRYHLWARVSGSHTGSNSFFVSVDGGPELAWHFPDVEGRLTTAGWEWVRVPAADGAPAHDLGAGLHRLRVHNREDGARLDRLLLTTDPGERPAP